MTRAVFMFVFLGAACAAVQGYEQKHAQGPEETSMLQTLLGQKLRNVETVVDKIAAGVSSRKQNTENAKSTDWEVCDQCDPTNLNIDSENRFCWPGTATYCDADPCDPENPLVSRPGWWCRPGTSKVIVSSTEYKRAGSTSLIHVNQPRSQQREFKALLAIPPARTWVCVPCDPNNDKVKGKWCLPKTADECSHPCDPCDPWNPFVNQKGWFCRRGTADVCVDHNGWTVLNYAASKFDANGTLIEGVIPASAIPTQTCSNNPLCLWGIVAGAIVVILVTAGAAAYLGGAFGAAGTVVVVGESTLAGGGGAAGLVGSGSVVTSASVRVAVLAEWSQMFNTAGPAFLGSLALLAVDAHSVVGGSALVTS